MKKINARAQSKAIRGYIKSGIGPEKAYKTAKQQGIAGRKQTFLIKYAAQKEKVPLTDKDYAQAFTEVPRMQHGRIVPGKKQRIALSSDKKYHAIFKVYYRDEDNGKVHKKFYQIKSKDPKTRREWLNLFEEQFYSNRISELYPHRMYLKGRWRPRIFKLRRYVVK